MSNFSFLSIFIIFISTILINLILIKYAYKFNLLDHPNDRKLHVKAIPYTGGLVLVIFFIIFGNYFFFNNDLLKLILFSSALIGILGFADDKFNLRPIIKILLITIIAIYVSLNNLNIVTLGSYSYIGNLYLGNYSIIFSVLCILFLTNAFNYNDGIDGITIFTFFTSSLLIILISNNAEINLLLIYINTVLIVILFFNLSIFRLHKIFLGNTGSLLLGFFYSLLMIYLSRYEEINPILIAWTISYLVYEFLSTNLLRLLTKKSLLQGGNDHMHYALLFRLNSKILTSFILNFLNIIFFSIGFYTLKISSLLSFVSFILIFFLYFVTRYFLFFRIKK